ncbi:MAG TPA: isoprenylcysteine carboxylmethyltransferase family protein [Candidatus Dormibacteraeota bacterium]|nr:isoprenylcysteine carboxylmethyltransferase family protein [Candidatus Dormibacteraeota bacterium]
MSPPVFPGRGAAPGALIVAFWVLAYVWMAGEIWLSVRHRPPAEARRRDRGSVWVVIVSVYLGVWLGIFVAFALPRLALTAGREAVVMIGLSLMVGGMALRWYAVHLLGTSFTCSVVTRPDQPLVQTGPYRWIRHPSYTGGLMTITGMLVALANPVSLATLLLPLGGYAYRIRVEEDALLRELGETYRAYMRRTWRLIPFLI